MREKGPNRGGTQARNRHCIQNKKTGKPGYGEGPEMKLDRETMARLSEHCLDFML